MAPTKVREHARQSPAFVVLASPKSGTTWLQRMLCAHPEVHCTETRPWGECYLPFDDGGFHINLDEYAGFLRLLMGYGDPHDAELRWSLARSLHTAVLGWVSDNTGKPVVGEKITPYEGGSRLAVERFARQNPELPVVHLVRDPRDVVVSAFVHHTRAHPPADARERERLESAVLRGEVPDSALARWVGNWRDVTEAAAWAKQTLPRVLEIRYEDLLADTELVFERVLAHIGVRHDAETVRRCAEPNSFLALTGRARGEEDRGNFFRKGITGDWVNWLTADQDTAVREGAGPAFSCLYGQSATAPDPHRAPTAAREP